MMSLPHPQQIISPDTKNFILRSEAFFQSRIFFSSIISLIAAFLLKLLLHSYYISQSQSPCLFSLSLLLSISLTLCYIIGEFLILFLIYEFIFLQSLLCYSLPLPRLLLKIPLYFILSETTEHLPCSQIPFQALEGSKGVSCVTLRASRQREWPLESLKVGRVILLKNSKKLCVAGAG